jgi:hypothetical protein
MGTTQSSPQGEKENVQEEKKDATQSKTSSIILYKLQDGVASTHLESDIDSVLKELINNELFYIKVGSKNIKVRALKNKGNKCELKEVDNTTSEDNEYYVPLVWDIISNVLKVNIKDRLNTLRRKIVSHIISEIKKSGSLSAESVGTGYTKATPSSDIDINVSYTNTKSGSDSIEIDMYKALGLTNTRHISNFKHNLDIMFDINLYPYSESIDCTNYDPSSDVLPHKRIARVATQYNLTPFFKRSEVVDITKYNTNSDEEGGTTLLRVSDLTTIKYADTLKDIYYSQAARCHIVKKKSPKKGSERYKAMYLYSFIDNFGFLLKTLFETNECTFMETYKRLSRVCKYLERMCDAIIERGTDNEPISRFKKLKGKCESINTVRKEDYRYEGSINSFYNNIFEVLRFLFTMQLTNKTDLDKLDPYSVETWLSGVLYFFNEQIKEYNQLLKTRKKSNGQTGHIL